MLLLHNGLGLRLLDGHPVLYTLHTVYVVGEFGGRVQFGYVAGLTIQCDHATVRLDHGFHSFDLPDFCYNQFLSPFVMYETIENNFSICSTSYCYMASCLTCVY